MNRWKNSGEDIFGRMASSRRRRWMRAVVRCNFRVHQVKVGIGLEIFLLHRGEQERDDPYKIPILGDDYKRCYYYYCQYNVGE